MNKINDTWKEKFFKNYYKDTNNISSCLEYKNKHFDKLYQYTKVKHADDLICDNLMYLRKFDELNDPFEGDLICDFGKSVEIIIEDGLKNKDKLEYNVRNWYGHKIKSLWEEVKKEMNISCFAEENSIIPMWAHYGGNHKGICVEYDFSETTLKNEIFPVYYVNPEENKVLCEQIFKEKDSMAHMMSQLFLRKGKDWNYEKEWRLIMPDSINNSKLNVCYKMGKKYLQFLNPSAVYLGYKIEKNDENYLKDLCELYDISVYKMDKDKSGYNLIPKPL